MDDGVVGASAETAWRWTGRRLGAALFAVCAVGGGVAAISRITGAGRGAGVVVRVEAPVPTAAPAAPLQASTIASATTPIAADAMAADAVGRGVASSPAVNSAYNTGVGGPSSGQGAMLTPLFTTRVGDRYDVRAFVLKVPSFSEGERVAPGVVSAGTVALPPRPGWTAPVYCQPSGYYSLEISDATMVGMAQGSYYDELRWGPVASVQFVGVAEGAPALVAVGQVGPGDALTMVLSDGRRIALTVRDGLAYAVVPFDLSSGPTDAPVAAWEVTTGGKTTMTTQSPWGVGVQYGSIPAECAPPPLPLPAPGEQPTDVDAARAAATVAVTTVFTGNTDEPARSGFIDDPHGLSDVRDALLSGGFASQVRNASVEVGDMVFTAPDRAAVRLTIVAVARFDLIGEARLVDGTWKVTRASYCDAANLAGVHCPD